MSGKSLTAYGGAPFTQGEPWLEQACLFAKILKFDFSI